MAHLWEPLRVCHKPMIVHLFSEVAGATNSVWMLALGFRKHCYEVWFKQMSKRCLPIACPSKRFLRSLELELYQVNERCSEGQSCLSACQETNYWTLSRQVCIEEKPEEPIVFLHGVGIGLVSLSLSVH